MRRIEAIFQATTEVESTSRANGPRAWTGGGHEPNTGDIAVKLRRSEAAAVDEVIADVRSKVRKTEPGLDIEFIQVLQDMIGDLTGAPEPGVVKSVLSRCRAVGHLGAQVAGRSAR